MKGFRSVSLISNERRTGIWDHRGHTHFGFYYTETWGLFGKDGHTLQLNLLRSNTNERSTTEL